jgi:hypothetical protein
LPHALVTKEEKWSLNVDGGRTLVSQHPSVVVVVALFGGQKKSKALWAASCPHKFIFLVHRMGVWIVTRQSSQGPQTLGLADCVMSLLLSIYLLLFHHSPPSHRSQG